MDIREVKDEDLEGLLKLYKHLHDNKMPEINEEILILWRSIIADDKHHIILAIEDGKIVSSCVLVIVPNLTHNQASYGLIENVVTDKNYRGKGYGTAVLNYAKEIADKEKCYKIMLLTGLKEESTLKFYEKVGFNRNDKRAFIKWI